jgi:pimeloyl-ACP methyl ester carboxylesterase
MLLYSASMDASPGMQARDEELAREIARIERSGERRTTPSADGTTTWHVFGSGPPIAFMHGGMGSWMHWIRNVPTLSRSHTLLLPDIPGHMGSAMPTPYTPQAVGAILIDGIDRILGPQASFSVVGFSFGAAIGGQVARLGGSRVDKFVMVSPGGLGLPRGEVRGIERWRHLPSPEERRAVHAKNLAASMIADPRHVDDLAVFIHATSTERAKPVSAPISLGNSLQECLPQVRARLAGIWGAHDPASSPFMAERRAYLHGLQPDAPIVVLDGVSHWLQYEAPERFDETLLDLLAR